MRRSGYCILIETPRGWTICGTRRGRVTQVHVDATDDDGVADAVASVVDAEGLRRNRLLIAPDARSSVFAAFPITPNAPHDRQALTFQLENSLPLDAEEVVADFQLGRQMVSCVAVHSRRWQPLVVALESRGLLVQSIVPATVLACQSLVRSHRRIASGQFVWQTPDSIELLEVSQRRLRLWKHLPGDADALVRELRVMQAQGASLGELTVIDSTSELLDALGEHHVKTSELESGGFLNSAIDGATRVLEGSEAPWFELRRGPLTNGDPHRPYRKELAWSLAAVAAFLLVLAGTWWWRAVQLDRQLEAARSTQRELFEETFPGTQVPRAIVSRIESEHARILGSRSLTADVPRIPSSMELLHAFLAGLPANVRHRVTEVQIDEDSLLADIELRSHDDAGRLASALEDAGFSVEPPTSTQRDDRTVFAQLQANWGPERNQQTGATTTQAGQNPNPAGI